MTLAASILVLSGTSAAATTSVAQFNRFAYTDQTTTANAAQYQFLVLGYGSGVRSQAVIRALIASIHANDPQTRVLLYKNYTVTPGDPLGIGGCAPWDSTLPSGGVPSSWFLTTASGTPVWNSQYGYYVLDPGNPQVQQACTSSAVAMAKLGGYDGVFWDSQHTSLFWASLSPWNCSSVTCQSDANWHASMTSWVTNVSAGLHANGLLSFGNIAGGNVALFGGGPTWWDAFMQAGFDGAAEESFTSGTNHLPVSLGAWKLELANALWNEANGKYLIANADVGSNQALNVYGLATMLLAAGGYSSWDANSGNYYSNEYWFPEYDTAL
ncbi:MAG TPA: putative glycoside hydrolase, partial [Solirubrobacteraceae bacterium]